MRISPPLPVSRSLAVASPYHPLVASANGNVLEIRHLDTAELLHCVTASGTAIAHIRWQTPSYGASTTTGTHSQCHLVAAASVPSNCVVIVNALTGAVVADVHDSPLVIQSLSFQGNYLLVSFEHSLGVVLYSLLNSRSTFIPFVLKPGTTLQSHASFSPCSKYIAIIAKKTGNDTVLLIDIRERNVNRTLTAPDFAGIDVVEGLKWTAFGLLVWGISESIPDTSMVVLLDANGELLDVHTMKAVAAECASTNVVKRATTVNTKVSVTMDSNLLAIAAVNGIALINALKWTLITQLDIPKLLKKPPSIFVEQPESLDSPTKMSSSSLPKHLLNVGNDLHHLSFSRDSRFLAMIPSRQKNVVLIYDIVRNALRSILVLEREVCVVKWGRGLIVSSGSPLHIWNADGVVSIDTGGTVSKVGCGLDSTVVLDAAGAFVILQDDVKGEPNEDVQRDIEDESLVCIDAVA